MMGSNKRTLAGDLALGLTITIALVTAAVSSLYYVTSTSSAEERLETQANEHVKRLSEVLAKPLLIKDEKTIIRNCWEYMQSHRVDVVLVFNAGGEKIYDLLVPPDISLFSIKKPVYYAGFHHVGDVVVSLSREGIIKTQRTTLYMTLTIMFSVILAVITACRLMLKQLLTKPLATLAQGIQDIAGGSYDRVIAPINRRDIDNIIEKINFMANLIASREKQLRNLIGNLRINRDRLSRSLDETVASLASTAEKRDPYTSGHQERVNRLALAIGKEMKLSDQQLQGLHIASLLHDIGKIALPAEYLAKPSLLSSIERAAIEHHTEVGYEILKDIFSKDWCPLLPPCIARAGARFRTKTWLSLRQQHSPLLLGNIQIKWCKSRKNRK